MSFVGGSISQAAAISGAEGRLAAVEALAAAKVAQTVYDAKVALVDAKDAEQDARLVAVEGRATALESDVSGRVQAAIDEKVAQTVFESLASELRSADSALTTALATKVSAVTQASVDSLQDSAIATKASIAGVNATVSNLVNAFNDEILRLDGVDASKVSQEDYNAMVAGLQGVDTDHDERLVALAGRADALEGSLGDLSAWRDATVMPNLSDLNGWRSSYVEAKVAAIEEFITVLLRTYSITKPNGSPYAYTGAAQGL